MKEIYKEEWVTQWVDGWVECYGGFTLYSAGKKIATLKEKRKLGIEELLKQFVEKRGLKKSNRSN